MDNNSSDIADSGAVGTTINLEGKYAAGRDIHVATTQTMHQPRIINIHVHLPDSQGFSAAGKNCQPLIIVLPELPDNLDDVESLTHHFYGT